MTQPAYSLYKGVWELIDWVFPPSCGGCGQYGDAWCDDCRGKTRPISGSLCETCGKRSAIPVHICESCEINPPSYTGLRSYSLFVGPLRHAIHQLKYQRDLGLGNVFAQLLFDIKQKLDWQVDYVIPVPLSKARLRQRGYNQAALIGYPLALLSGIRYTSRLLKRTRDTRSQVGLSQSERRTNVHDAFYAHPTACAQISFLVIDDVTTTGSTLDACAAALLQAGAKQVYGLTVARTEFIPEVLGINEKLLEGQSPGQNPSPGGSYGT